MRAQPLLFVSLPVLTIMHIQSLLHLRLLALFDRIFITLYSHLHVIYFGLLRTYEACHSFSTTTLLFFVFTTILALVVAAVTMEQWGEQSNAPTIEADKAGLLSHKTTRPTWRRFLSSKGSWLAVIMVMLSFGLILGLSIGLTVGRKHSKQGSAQQAGQPVPPANNDSNSPQPLASLVDLGYVKYQGDTYQNGISQWVGIRYAQPPIGNLRFAAPQNVTGNGTLEDATQVSPSFLQLSRASLTSFTAPPSLHRDAG